MSLNEKQARFTRCVGQLLAYAFSMNLPVILAEAYRPPETAKLFAEQDKGIENSVHTKKLAVDLFRVLGTTVTWDYDQYVALGEYWKTLDPDARWGGDFESKDAVHFSFFHNGVA